MLGYALRTLVGRSPIQKIVQQHFNGVGPGDICSASREFPFTSRVDPQAAVEQSFAGRSGNRPRARAHAQSDAGSPPRQALERDGRSS
jgi:hypothetical protein